MKKPGWQFSLQAYVNSVDWKLLIFLILLLDVKLIVKAVALFSFLLMHGWPNWHFFQKKLPSFYPLIILITIVTAFTNGLINKGNYPIVLLMGLCYWLACIVAYYHIYKLTESQHARRIYHTIILFFIVNAIISYATLLGIIIESAHLNPYRYQGSFQKYFISTGDYIKGLSFDTSTTNAALNAMGILFFLKKNNYRMTLLCLSILLLTCSNTLNLLLSILLLLIFILDTSRLQKSMISICLCIAVLFQSQVTPQNSSYSKALFHHFFEKDTDEKTQKIIAVNNDPTEAHAQQFLDSVRTANKPVIHTNADNPVAISYIIPGDSIHTPPFQHKDDTNNARKEMMLFLKKNNLEDDHIKLPGKALAFLQTVSFFKSHPRNLILGTGIGTFSSKLAFRTTGLNITGTYPLPAFIHPYFENNHLKIFLNYFTRPDGFHSLINTPNAVFNQIMGEYGLLGLISLIVFYFWKFWRRSKASVYMRWILLLVFGLCFIDYWFEQLSLIPFCELLFLLNLKEAENSKYVST